MEAMRQKLCLIISDVSKSKVGALRDLANGRLFSWTLWILNKERFPFYEKDGQMQVKKSSQSITIDEYNAQNRSLWKNILRSLSKVKIEDWQLRLDDFEDQYLEPAINGDEQALEYFCFIFIEFIKKANPLTFEKNEKLFDEVLTEMQNLVLNPEYIDSSSKKSCITQDLVARFSSSRLNSAYKDSATNYREFNKSISSSQELVNMVSDMKSEIQVLTEDLIFKEKQVNSLKDKLSVMKEEKNGLQEEVENKAMQICRLSEQVERQEDILQQQRDTRSRHSMDLANQKIGDLQSEVEELQKKNIYLQRRMDDLLLAKRMAGEGVNLSQDSIDSEERRESTIRTLNRENTLLKEKLALSDKNIDMISDKLLRWKDQVDKSERTISELHAELTKKEIHTTALLNEKKSLTEANEELKDSIVKKNFEIKQLELDFKRTIEDSLKKEKFSSPTQTGSTDDSNLELVKVTKEVNRMLTKELECLYCLLHDTFVSELTGRTLDEMIKSKLVDRNREILLQPC